MELPNVEGHGTLVVAGGGRVLEFDVKINYPLSTTSTKHLTYIFPYYLYIQHPREVEY